MQHLEMKIKKFICKNNYFNALNNFKKKSVVKFKLNVKIINNEEKLMIKK